MTKVKRNLRKSTRRTTKQRQKSKRSRKSRKLRRQTRSRRSKMRGGMDIKTIGGFIAALFAVVKTDTGFIDKNGDTNIEFGPEKQFDVVNEYAGVLEEKINDPSFKDSELKGFNLPEVLHYIEEKKQEHGLDSKVLDVEIPNEYIVEPKESAPDAKPDDKYFDANEF
uniref:Uncharacterized protein n=1 Tax=viral metagenome TaxID=1070528 RepID=A0A6C0E5Q2_9ZZZZ